MESSEARPKPTRLQSLDALRGFDMFWIIGGATLLRSLAEFLGYPSFIDVVTRQTTHVGWDGYVAWDLIFPLFVFMTGVTMPLSLVAKREQGVPSKTLYRRVARRWVLLIFLGLLPGLLRMDWANVRPLSVLGLIGTAYFIAAMIVLHRGVRGQTAWLIGLLVGYWTAMYWIPVPGIGRGVITPGGNLAAYIDSHLLPGKLYQGVFDPEGILCSLSAASIALMGALAGHLLRSTREPSGRTSAILAGAGLLSLLAGHVAQYWFPVIKALWSSSFILVAGGWSLLLLALFYLIVDVWRLRWPLLLFVPIGMNAITIYVARYYVDFAHTASRLFGGLANSAGKGPARELILAAGVIAVEWCLLYFLYRKKIFLRV